MDFYTMLADVYDDLFPAEPSILQFLTNTFSSCRRLLDVACGTGTYTIPLWEQGKEVVGIDLSLPMIQQAREKLQQMFRRLPQSACDKSLITLQGRETDFPEAPAAQQGGNALPKQAAPAASSESQGQEPLPRDSAPAASPARGRLPNQFAPTIHKPLKALPSQEATAEVFLVEDMRNLSRFPLGSFQGLYCIGNSLPHLDSEAQIRAALAQFHRVLAPEGILLLQTINFDRVRFDSSGRFDLPTLKGKQSELARFYTPGPDSVHLYFESELFLPDGQRFRTRIPLFILTRNRLEAWLQDTGFESLGWYGSYEGKAYEPENSFLTIVVARVQAKGKSPKDTRVDSIVP